LNIENPAGYFACHDNLFVVLHTVFRSFDDIVLYRLLVVLHTVFRSFDDIVLYRLLQLDKEGAVSHDPHHEVLIVFRVLLGLS